MLQFSPRLFRFTTQSIYKSLPTKTLRHQSLINPIQRLASSTTANKMATNNPDLEISNLFDVKGKVALVTGGGKTHNPETS